MDGNFSELGLGRLLGNLPATQGYTGDKMNVRNDPQNRTNFIQLDMKQLNEKPKTTNFQQRLREVAENYDFFHILCSIPSSQACAWPTR